ncbi:MAG: hypothetical protein ACJAS4_003570 [Bacteriovoracaceae bacterium]|jgi:hypothetical protein
MIFLQLLIFILSLNTFSAQAGIEQAPPSFYSGTKKAVWTDFIEAKYELSFDSENEVAISVSTIEFEVIESGFPIFDVVGFPIRISMNGDIYAQQEIRTPDRESIVRIIDRELSPGRYTVEIESIIAHGVVYGNDSVSVGFFMKDMRDRQFLERYIPSNYEYDQYKMEVSLRILGAKKEHRLFTNGKLVESSHNYFKYSYPDYFTSSSLYIHMVPVEKFKVQEFTYKSKLSNGRDFPVTIYSKNYSLTKRTKREVIKVLKELETDYGPWPHPGLVFYSDGKWRGGMEYAGAGTSGWFAIGHELQHNYFARGVMPANGDAGWIDEAVASWRDFSTIHKFTHFGSEEPNFSSMNLGNQSVFNRKTDKRSYEDGRAFMFYLDSILKERPEKSLKKFLRIYYNKRKFSTVDQEDFRKDLEEYYGGSLRDIFNQYIYGLGDHSDSEGPNPFHSSISDDELGELI